MSNITNIPYTYRYVGPIKQGLKNKVQREPDPKNPANWDNERLSAWVTGKSKAFCKGKVKPETLCPWETGKQLLSLSESELLKRLQADGLSEKAAKEFYLRKAFNKFFLKNVKKVLEKNVTLSCVKSPV